MRIIGCGNRERMDDGAGVLVALHLRSLGVQAVIQSGEALALVDAWAGSDDIIVVDAVITGAPTGTVHVWDSQHSLPLTSSPASTHGLGVAEAVELARALGKLPSRLRIFGIEGAQFGVGSGLSPEVKSAVEEVGRRILAQLHRREGKRDIKNESRKRKGRNSPRHPKLPGWAEPGQERSPEKEVLCKSKI